MFQFGNYVKYIIIKGIFDIKISMDIIMKYMC